MSVFASKFQYCTKSQYFRYSEVNSLVNLQYFSRIYAIYCEIREIFIIKSLLFVIFWFPLSDLCTSRLTSGVRERDLYLFCNCFFETNWYCLLHSYTLYI